MDNKTDSFIEKLLAEMPIDASKNFTENVLAEIKKEQKLDEFLAEMPVEPSENFVEKTLQKIAVPENEISFFRTKIFSFPRHLTFPKLFVGAAAAAALVFAISPIFLKNPEKISSGTTFALEANFAEETQNLAEKAAESVLSDPELYALCCEDEALSFEDFLETSEIFAAIDLSNLEILAYNND